MKKFVILFFVIFAISIQENSFSEAKENKPRPTLSNSFAMVVATVNNHIITRFDVEDRYRLALLMSKIKVNSNAEKMILLNQIVDKMIDEELIKDEAKNLGISFDEQQLHAIIESIALKQKQSLSSLKNNLAKHNISFATFESQIIADLLWSKIITESVRSHIKISNHDITEFFEQNKMESDIIKYSIAEIFINNGANSKILAEKLYSELKNGADFKNIVKQFSQSPSAENYGEIGYIAKNEVDEKIYNAIYKLEKNQYSEPVFITDGYYIFKLLDKKTVSEIKEKDLENAHNFIFSKQLEVEAKSYLMNLRKKAFIEININKML